MNDDILIVQLRDCFTAGYTFPQFCIDNNIKKPLFVAVDERRADFIWEIYVQFKYDLRMDAQFAFIGRGIPPINFSVAGILGELEIKNLVEFNLNQFDKIIFLTIGRLNVPMDKIIYLDQLTNYFISRTYVEIPLLHFLKQHKDIKLILTSFPAPSDYKGGNELNDQLYDIKDLREMLDSENIDNIETPFAKFGYTNSEIREILRPWKMKINPDKSAYLEDDDNPLVRIENGRRRTANQPEKFINRIYFVGASHHLGAGAPFDKTIASYLQKMLNDNNLPYRVENEAQYFWPRFIQHTFYNLEHLSPQSGDIFFAWFGNLRTTTLPFFDISRAFDGYDYREIFAFKNHVNEIGFKILAEKFFQLLVQNNFFKNTKIEYSTPPLPPHRYGIPRENSAQVARNFDNKELDEHKQKLREKRLKIGCIVMNANPFTLGHEHLVEYAAARVHKLFIMVVSEDKSEFSFDDRFEMVKRGTEKFPNVEVLPSGQFVISQKTFEGYFNKENLQDVQVDSSQDVEIFASEIAPSLGVNIRFVGEEPEDTVTKTYNENMRNILPRYDIDFCEIPRREIDGEVISAKTVRAALKAGDLDKLKKLVPVTTFDYLREKYFPK